MRAAAPKKMSDTVRRLVHLFLLAYLVLLAPLLYFQRSLIYHPSRCERLAASDAGLPQAVVYVTVKSHDGLDLHGWLALAGTSPGSVSINAIPLLEAGRPVVLYFPGNAGNRSMRFVQLAALGSLNAHVLIVDYRGYAENSGNPSEANFARDARSVWNHLTGELGVRPDRVVIYGESLGGGVATRLASELCQEGTEPGGLIVQSTFSSLVAVGQTHFPVLPVSLILVDRYSSDVRIQRVTCPILQIHGQKDSIVPLEIGQRLFDAAPANSSRGIAKKQIVMPHTDHNDVYSPGTDASQLTTGLKSFLEEVDLRRERNAKPTKRTVTQSIKPPVDAGQWGLYFWPIIGSLLLAAFGILRWRMTNNKPRK